MSGHSKEEEIALLAGNDLDTESVPDVSSHMASCPDCAARLAAYRNDRQSLAALRDIGVGALDFAVVRLSVLERIDRERAVHRQFDLLQWCALAAALLIAVGAGTWWWTKTSAPRTIVTSRKTGPAQEARTSVRLETSIGPTAQSRTNQASVTKPAKPPHIEAPKPAFHPLAPASSIAEQAQSPAHAPVELDDVVMKLETSDPNISIIWLASPKGAGR